MPPSLMEKVAAPVIILEANTHVAASETQNEHETRMSLGHFVTIMISAFMKCYQPLAADRLHVGNWMFPLLLLMSSFLKVLMLGVEMELGNSFSVLYPLMLVLKFQQLLCDREGYVKS